MSVTTMPSVKRRVKPGDMELVHNGAIRHWCIRTTYPLHECVNDDFLLNQRGSFNSGDTIDLLRFDNDTWKSVLETWRFITVKYSDAAGVKLDAIEAHFRDLNEREDEQGIVVARGQRGSFVIRIDGTTHTARNTVVEANEFAVEMARMTGKPVQLLDLKKPRSEKAA
jgi:hypothetical protein